MIINIDHTYACSVTEPIFSDQCAIIISNGHYISCTHETRDVITKAINTHGSSSQKQLFRFYKGFDITEELRKYLTTIDINHYKTVLKPLLESPSELLIENSIYEWEVYKYLPEVYKHDPQFKNIYALVSKAIKDRKLTYMNGGGHTQYVPIIEQKDNELYKGVYKMKCCAIFDRDTDDNTYYDSQKNHHFKFFSQKDSQTISDNEIYNLNQTNGWIWHMWYKRAIENYFPKERYEKLSVSIDEDEISDYENIGQKYKSKGYKKEMVPKLAKDMSRTMYERGLKHFTVNGIDMSEMQLLLLKFAKIV